MNPGRLRAELLRATETSGCSMDSLTVQSDRKDPFRLDTKANHVLANWFVDTLGELGRLGRVVHLRGCHYVVLGATRPDGSVYANTDKCWQWLTTAAKAARWLGAIPFDQIEDHRNAAPTIREYSKPDPTISVSQDALFIDIPFSENLSPWVTVDDFVGTQPYKLVLVGEKSSLAEVLDPIAARHGADLYLPSGDMSDTLVYRIAETGSRDPRTTVVLYFADADPAGWNMSIVVSHKLRAVKTLLFPDWDFQVHRVGLTPDQVRRFDLPSTPLKDTERRADRWRLAMGTEQTEIDALAALRPELLRQLAGDAIAPFFDYTLNARVDDARRDWRDQAQAEVDVVADTPDRRRQLVHADQLLDEIRDQISDLNDSLQIDTDNLNLPDLYVPAPRVATNQPTPLADSRWDFSDQAQRLIADKIYEKDEAA